jgi:hypothetical protein
VRTEASKQILQAHVHAPGRPENDRIVVGSRTDRVCLERFAISTLAVTQRLVDLAFGVGSRTVRHAISWHLKPFVRLPEILGLPASGLD